MCGIVGIFNLKNDNNRVINDIQQSFLINFILTESLLHTEKRGKDATGYHAIFRNGESLGLKNGKKSSEFVFDEDDNPELTYAEHMRVLETYHTEISPIESIIGHCRASTVGAVYDNDNNHPILVNDRFVGIHNGTLSNHKIIEDIHEDDITRIGSVDSEMLVQLAKVWSDRNEGPFTTETCDWIYSRIDGPCVTLIADRENPNTILWIKAVRPLIFYYIKEAGLLVAISESSIFEAVVAEYRKLKRIYNMQLPTLTFKPSTAIDKHCGVIDTAKEIEKVDNPTANFIDKIAGDAKLSDVKMDEYMPKKNTTTAGRTNTPTGANYNNNYRQGNGNTTTNAANNSTSNNTAPTGKTIKTSVKVKTLSFVNGDFMEEWCDKDDIIPKDPKSEGNKSNIGIDDDLENIRPLQNVYSEYSVESIFKNTLKLSYANLSGMSRVELAKNVEKVCMIEASKVLARIKKDLAKVDNSAVKTRRRLLTTKKFLAAILPFTSMSEIDVVHATELLTKDDVSFLYKFIPKTVFNKMPASLRNYVNSKLDADNKEITNYA